MQLLKKLMPDAALAKKLKAALPDLLLVGGAASVSYGAWMVYAPAGFLVAGVLAIVAGVILAKAA